MTAPRLEIILTSLRAEGTPRLTLEMCRIWVAQGLDVGVTVLFPQPANLLRDFEKIGIAPQLLALPDGLLRRWIALARWAYALRRRHPGVAILSMPFGWHAWAFAGAALAGRGRGIVHIGNHPMDESGARRLVFRALVLAGRPFTHGYVCCSRHVAAGVERVFGLRATSLRVVPNGVIVPPLRSRMLPKEGELRIGMVATLEAHKDHTTLLRAFPELAARVAGRGLRPHLLLAGDGSLERCLRDLAETLGIAHQVTFLGTVSDVPGLLDRLDAFVFSTTDAEGQGIAMLEAMAAGVPIAASDVGACREVLDGGDAGLLFTAGDPAALADAVMGMLDDPDAVEARRGYAHRKVAEVFDVARTARSYAELAGLA